MDLLAFHLIQPGVDARLRSILGRHNLDGALLQGVFDDLHPLLSRWAGRYLVGVRPAGSVMKGTAVSGQTDLDVFISLNPEASMGLRDIYFGLRGYLTDNGFSPRQQDVSLGIKHRGFSVDVTAGRQHPTSRNYHSIYRSRANTWTQTNIDAHIDIVRRSERQEEIRLLKIWRHQKKLDFPSFLLELATLEALHDRPQGQLGENLRAVFRYLMTELRDARLVDPSNTNNVVSDDLTNREKLVIAARAAMAYRATDWDEIVR